MSGARNITVVEFSFTCEECKQPATVQTNKNTRHRYCMGCKPLVMARRKKLERERRILEQREPGSKKPRLVRYAGYDPSERH